MWSNRKHRREGKEREGERERERERERKRGQMQSLPFWELWTGTEKRVKLKAYDERVLSGHHEDEKERERNLSHMTI